MQLPSNAWHIPHSPKQCANLNHTVSCNFGLYSNATNLSENEKLAPNPDLTGNLIFKSFIITAFISLSLSVALCLDKIHYRCTRGNRNSLAMNAWYLQTLHTVETLLQAASDSQFVAAVSLLFTLNDQACSISACDFNIVCTMLLLSVIIHLTAMINISDFIFRGKKLAFARVAVIVFQLMLTAWVFSARNTSTFPFESNSLAIMPAACFENLNASDDLGLSDLSNLASNVTSNTNGTSGVWDNIQAATSKTKGLPEYVVLVLFILISCFVVLCEWLFAQTKWDKNIGWGSIIVSIASTTTGILLAVYTFVRYNDLMSAMEVPALYQMAKDQPLTLSQILPLSLLASTILPVISAVTASLVGHRSRRFTAHLDEFQETFGEAEQTELTGLMRFGGGK